MARPCACDRPGCRLCELYRTRADYRAMWDRADPQVRPSPQARPPGGVGTEIKKLLVSLGIPDMAGCGCDDYAAELDLNGPAWCRGHATEIADRLREKAAKVGWAVKLGAAARAVAAGLVLNPLDPYHGLLLVAIQRAEAKV